MLTFLTFAPKDTYAKVLNAYKLTDPFITFSSSTTGGPYFLNRVTTEYQGGKMILSANPDGTGDILAPDELSIWNTPISVGGVRTFSNRTTSSNCLFHQTIPPTDISNRFQPGENSTLLRLLSWCRLPKSISSIYLVNFVEDEEETDSPEPFLDLPWDYKSKGMTFTQAALAINSYFDHTYPVLSISAISESENYINQLTTYDGEVSTQKRYSSHDGYDYGKSGGAKVYIDDEILAAASGWATYRYCGACGNMIHIDHENGYQTRYLHMQETDLITNNPDHRVWVEQGQPIGLVGATGNVIPKGEAGAHIHFSVVHDKDGDGNFNNNIPDGLVDPFGWQSDEPDPWETYTFEYLEQQKTGAKSYYLWQTPLTKKTENLTPSGGVFEIEQFLLDFNKGVGDGTVELTLEPASVVEFGNKQSLGTSINITASDSLGNVITQFSEPFILSISFAGQNLSRYLPDSLSIFSSQDGINWQLEQTQINNNAQTATAQVDHLTQFALFGERKDTTPPTTLETIEGDKGIGNWYRSDVNISLEAIGNHGGLGTDYTMYKTNASDWKQYKYPLTFTQEGSHKIEFYSVDNDENIEDIKSIEFQIDKTAPSASVSASPNYLWPPNGEMINVQITGNTQDANIQNTTISVEDEYKTIQPTILGFGETIKLEAKREGSDTDGRKYIIKVEAIDKAGNKSSSTALVTVPHDQKIY